MNNNTNDNNVETTYEDDQCRPGFFRRFVQKRRAKRGAWWKRKRLNRLSAKLDLELSQREALEAIFTEMQSVKTAAFNSRKSVGAGLAAAIQGESFNDELAREALQEPIVTIQSKMDSTLARFAEWFNQLNETQQQQLREMLQSRFVHCGPRGA